MYLSYESRSKGENNDWYWNKSVSELKEICDSAEQCLKGLHFKLLNGLTTKNNRYLNDVLAFEGLTVGEDTLLGNTFKIVLDFDSKSKFEGFEYLHYDSEFTKREIDEMLAMLQKQIIKSKMQESFERNRVSPEELCTSEFIEFLDKNTFINKHNRRVSNLPLEQIEDSVALYSNCLVGIPFHELDSLLDFVPEENLHKKRTIFINDSLFPFPPGEIFGGLSISLDTTKVYVSGIQFSYCSRLGSVQIDICYGNSPTKEQLRHSQARAYLSHYFRVLFPYYEKKDISLIMWSEEVINEELDKWKGKAIGMKFPDSWKSSDDFKFQKKDGYYVIEALDGKQGIHKLNYSEFHKLIIKVNDEELIQSIEYVCP